MPGSGNTKRQHAAASLAYLLRQEGKTNRQIAEALGKPLANIPKWVALGERFAQGKQAEQGK